MVISLIVYISLSLYLDNWNPSKWSFKNDSEDESEDEIIQPYLLQPTPQTPPTPPTTNNKKGKNKSRTYYNRGSAGCSNRFSHKTGYIQYQCKRFEGYYNENGKSYDTFKKAQKACDSDVNCHGIFIRDDDRKYRTSSNMLCPGRNNTSSELERAYQTDKDFDYIAVKPNKSCCTEIVDQNDCTPSVGCLWNHEDKCVNNFITGVSRVIKRTDNTDSEQDIIVLEDNEIVDNETYRNSETSGRTRANYIRFSNVFPLNMDDVDKLKLHDTDIDEAWETYNETYSNKLSINLDDVVSFCTSNVDCAGIVESVIGGIKRYVPVQKTLICRKTVSQDPGTEEFRLNYDVNDPLVRSIWIKDGYSCGLFTLPCDAYRTAETCDANAECIFSEIDWITKNENNVYPDKCVSKGIYNIGKTLRG